MSEQDSHDSELEQIANFDELAAYMERKHQSRIRDLNDQLRTHGRGGIVVMTDGIATLGASTVNEVFRAVAAFDGFNQDNDPHGEHDCAILTVAAVQVLWKIDYYDRSRRFLSPEPADPKVTVRILTVMRADEY